MKNARKNVLIITDDSNETAEMAAGIAAALKGNKVSVKPVSDFRGNDILPAEAFFLGCEKPNPASFGYIEDLFMHINLAGRPCGVFSPGSKKATQYLARILHDSEAALNPEPLLGSSETKIGKWCKNVLTKSF
jgi:hypothetical protein